MVSFLQKEKKNGWDGLYFLDCVI